MKKPKSNLASSALPPLTDAPPRMFAVAAMECGVPYPMMREKCVHRKVNGKRIPDGATTAKLCDSLARHDTCTNPIACMQALHAAIRRLKGETK